MKSLSNVFFNPASWTRQSMVLFVTPLRKRETDWFAFPGVMVIVMLAFCVFSAAVFAEPTVA
ncbi:MAG TPA: hypothetical protein VJ372_19520 [Pyrinomonadaceae bacterium]|nr:hypothetical protein [Pyrinomonadaceae bacterium]